MKKRVIKTQSPRNPQEHTEIRRLKEYRWGPQMFLWGHQMSKLAEWMEFLYCKRHKLYKATFKQTKWYKNYKWISTQLDKFKRRWNFNQQKAMNQAWQGVSIEKAIRRHQRVQGLILQQELQWRRRNSTQQSPKSLFQYHLIVLWMNQLISTNSSSKLLTELHLKLKLKKSNKDLLLMAEMIMFKIQKTFIRIQAQGKIHLWVMVINLLANCTSQKKKSTKSLKRQDHNESNSPETKSRFFVTWVTSKPKTWWAARMPMCWFILICSVKRQFSLQIMKQTKTQKKENKYVLILLTISQMVESRSSCSQLSHLQTTFHKFNIRKN